MGHARLKRGDIVTAVLAGDYGKPRPCLVVQSDQLVGLDSVLVCPLTSDLATAGPARLTIAANAETGLAVDSLVMVDKITAVARSRCRDRIGKADATTIDRLGGLLLFALGLLD